jgi:tRNA-specific 2-thiouridylase
VATGEPRYVVAVDAVRNRVVVGGEGDLLKMEAEVREVNWVSCPPPTESVEAEVKIRYRARPARALIHPTGTDRVRLVFAEPQRAVAPGQSAVFYRGDVVLGGGVLEEGARSGSPVRKTT